MFIKQAVFFFNIVDIFSVDPLCLIGSLSPGFQIQCLVMVNDSNVSITNAFFVDVFGMQEGKVPSVQVGSKSRALTLSVKATFPLSDYTDLQGSCIIRMHIQKYR